MANGANPGDGGKGRIVGRREKVGKWTQGKRVDKRDGRRGEHGRKGERKEGEKGESERRTRGRRKKQKSKMRYTVEKKGKMELLNGRKR